MQCQLRRSVVYSANARSFRDDCARRLDRLPAELWNGLEGKPLRSRGDVHEGGRRLHLQRRQAWPLCGRDGAVRRPSLLRVPVSALMFFQLVSEEPPLAIESAAVTP